MIKQAKNILEKYSDYSVNIGIEVHVQLKTKSKIFCSCPNQFGDKPNTNICPICAGYPGVLPVLNKKVVDFAILAGLATNCKITQISKFARKHYTYPDLPKNFQITQNNEPLCTQGFIPIDLTNGKEKKIRLTRIHIEEDAGKTIHKENKGFIDLNRAGTPLLEIVSYPDMSNSNEAKLYLTRLRSIIQYLGISDVNMEEGSFRGDINISVKKKDAKELGTKVELKNINSFKFIVNAIEYEIERQIKCLETNQKIYQETRSWDTKNNKSIVMRSKEEAQDYKYLREPDLPLIIVNKEWIEKIEKDIPELPHTKIHRFIKEYNINYYEAEILISDIEIANFFEQVATKCKSPKKACNWILRDLLRYLNENKISLKESKVTVDIFSDLINQIELGTINTKVAQDIFIEMMQTGKSPAQIIDEKGLKQIDNEQELKEIIIDIIKRNQDQLEKYLSGKDRLFSFFVGQAMKATKGKGNPQLIQKILKENLKK